MLKKKVWSVMIYMAGDNNLSVDMAYALEVLEKKVVVNENDNIKLYVHYENNSPEIPSIYCDFSDVNNSVYQYSTEIGNKFSTRRTVDFNSSEAITPVLDFVDWCVNNTENTISDGGVEENFALIFSGHTMGFLTMGLLKDESKNVSMTMPGLQTGLEIIRDEITGKKLSILGFDSCVMSMFEVGQQFKTVANTMIASEGSIPNAGWTYTEILSTLANSNETVTNIAGEFVQKYIEKQSKYSIGGVSVDMAAWDLTKLDELNNKFGRLTNNLLKCFEDESSIIYRQMRRILLQVHFNAQTYMYEQSIDLGDFCSLLIEEIASIKDETERKLDTLLRDVQECCQSVLLEINKCVILSGFSGGTYQFSTGISLFFPWSVAAYQVSVNDYEQLNFVQNTHAGRLWNLFLQTYLGEVSLRKGKTETNEYSFANNAFAATQSQTNEFAHRLPVSQSSRVPESGQTRIPLNPISRLPVNPISRVPLNPISRIPLNPISKLPLNPISRVPLNPISKLPLNPISRISGESGKFFENFTKFKNVEAKWNIKGYTKDFKKNG